MKIWKSRRIRRGIGLLVLFFSLFIAPNYVFSGGGKDSTLEKADKLINERHYDDAIRELIGYVAANPDDFSAAQKRFQQIIKLRDQYNVLADQLLDIIAASPEDAEQILVIIDRLFQVEANPSPVFQDFLNRTRSVALFAYNRKRLELVISRADAHLAAGRYAEALRTYAGGLDIYRDEFYEADYGEMAVAIVENGLEMINGVINRFGPLAVSLNSRLDTLEQNSLNAQGPAGAAALDGNFEQAAPLLVELVEYRNSLAALANNFLNQLALLREADASLGDNSFLSFASRLVMGRAGEMDGMMGSLEKLWVNSIARVDRAVKGMTGRTYRTALTLSNGRRYDEAAVEFNSLAAYWRTYQKLIAIENSRRIINIPPAITINADVVVLDSVEGYLNYFSMEKMIPFFNNIRTVENSLNRINESDARIQSGLKNGTISGTEAFEQDAGIRQSYANLQGDLAGVLGELNADEALVASYAEQAGSGPFTPVYISDVRSRYLALAALAKSNADASNLNACSTANEEVRRRLAQLETGLAESQSLIDGRVVSIPGQEPYTAKYPAEANQLLSRLVDSASRDIQFAGVFMGRLAVEREQPARNPLLEDIYQTTSANYARLNEIYSLGQELLVSTDSLRAQAENYRLDGDRLLREAEAALAQNNFDLARDRLLRAGDRYDASLAIEDTERLRATRDQRLLAIGSDITRRESEIIVREVRQLTVDARVIFFTGNFEQAEELLLMAQNRWRVLSPLEGDAEVDYWLSMVRNALSQLSGKFIPVTAPLYSEMSQLLNDAHRAYDEGARLLSAGRREEGLRRLNESIRKTQELRLVFPMNQEAGILQLRIDQIIDPRAFEASFEQRFTTAMNTIRSTRSQEAFADLQNLAAINPRYRGMAAAVNEAEIIMGVRPPPPNPRDLAQSRQLTQSARAIAAGNVQSQLPIALEQLNRAIVLDPANAEAISLKDQVQIRIGGETVVLSTAAEREYKRAVEALQQGNTIVALSIVQQLLQNPANRNSARILELQRRIESIL